MICPQLILFVTLSIINVIGKISYYFMNDKHDKKTNRKLIFSIITTILYSIGMSVLYYYLCINGYMKSAWILLIIPFIVFITLIILGLLHNYSK